MRIAYATLPPELNGNFDLRFNRPPLAAGYLAAYVHQFRGKKDSHDLVDPYSLGSCQTEKEAVEILLRSKPQLVALTVYVWNKESTRRVVEKLRNSGSNVKIILGGPEVAFIPFSTNIPADWVCTGEGEIPFLHLVQKLSRAPKFRGALPGMVCLNSSRKGVTSGNFINNLDDIPSPYSEGFISLEPGGWMDVETMRGCPFSCRFCLYGKNFTRMRYFSMDRVFKDIRFGIEAKAGFLYFMDPTFNFPKDRCSFLCQNLATINRNKVSIYVEARAEIVDETQAEEFKQAGITSVEVGLQSIETGTLQTMQRTLAQDRFVRGCELLRERGIEVEIGVILGLPGDTEESVRRTIEFVCNRQLGNLSLHRLQVLPGSEYAGMAEQIGLVYETEPPYFILSTPAFSEEDINCIENEFDEFLNKYNRDYQSRLSRISMAFHKRKKQLGKSVAI